MSDQLRRFLDDQVWLENRRVIDLLRSIETKALRVRHMGDPDVNMELDDSRVEIVLPVERPLYCRTNQVSLQKISLEHGNDDFDSSALTSQLYVDRDLLTQRILSSIGRQSQVSLNDVIASEPLTHGLAELIGYLSLDEPGLSIIFDDDRRDRFEWSADQVERAVELPSVNFSRDQSVAP